MRDMTTPASDTGDKGDTSNTGRNILSFHSLCYAHAPMPRSDISFPLKDAELREDVHMLGALVGEVIREQGGDALFEAVEKDRQAAIARRDGDEGGTLQLIDGTRDVPASQARDLVRAFSTWFEMVNMAEKVHRIRRRRQYLNEGVTQPGGIEEAVVKLKEQGLTLPDIRHLM